MKRAFLKIVCISVLFSSFVEASLRETATERRVRIASEVIEHRMKSQRPIPAYVSDAALCMASLKVVKAGLIWGGQGSTGLVSCRVGDEWSSPSFFNVGGVNFGLQIGIQFMESVLVFITDYGREILEKATFQLGVDISVAAGPVGGGGGTGVLPDAHILSYDRSKGLYAGATINGFILTHGKKRNEEVYGEGATPKSILDTKGKSDKSPQVVQTFVDTMNKYFE